MGIAPDVTGSTSMTAAATSATVDITAAAVGAWVYAWVALGINAGAVSSTGWTSLLDADDGTSAHYALLRRQKVAGDTTFMFSWTTSTKGTIGWASYTGLDPTTVDEGATLVTNGVTSRTAVPTPSATPTAANRWAVAFFGVRTTTVGNKPISWTPDAATTERLDVDNNAAGSAPWMGLEIADTNSAVTQASHSYTATHNAAESHDGSAILFLIPAPTATTAPSVIHPGKGPHRFARFIKSVIQQVNVATIIPDQAVNPVGIPSAEQFGTATVSNVIVAAGIPTTEQFGTVAVTQVVSAQGIPSAEQFGTSSISATYSINAVGILTAEVVGSATVVTSIAGVGVPSAEQFGVATVATSYTINATGIPTAEQLGVASIGQAISAVGISSAERLGVAAVTQIVSAVGIPSTEVFGLSVITLTVGAIGIPSAERFGVGSVAVGGLGISGVGIPSTEQFGAATVAP